MRVRGDKLFYTFNAFKKNWKKRKNTKRCYDKIAKARRRKCLKNVMLKFTVPYYWSAVYANTIERNLASKLIANVLEQWSGVVMQVSA